MFGADKKKRIDGAQKGSHLFFDAQILFLPVQDESNYFHWVTTKSILLAFIERMKLIGIEYNGTPEELLIILKSFLAKGYEVEVIENQKFIEYCDDDNLPIIARNKLDNGESANLWYEQILPQETIFYTMILEQGKHTLDLNNKIVQIGANATIGYGCCKFSNVKFENL